MNKRRRQDLSFREVGARNPWPEVGRRSYLTSTPGKTTPLPTAPGSWLFFVVRAASHPVYHRYIISRALCPSAPPPPPLLLPPAPLDKTMIFTAVSSATSPLYYLYGEAKASPCSRAHITMMFCCIARARAKHGRHALFIDPLTHEAAFTTESFSTREFEIREYFMLEFFLSEYPL